MNDYTQNAIDSDMDSPSVDPQALDAEVMPPEEMLKYPMAGELAEQLRRSTTDMLPFMWQWTLCDRFLAGDQYLTVASSGSAQMGMTSIIGAKRRGQTVFNVLPSFLRAKLAQMQMLMPDIAVAPNVPEQGDIARAIGTEECWRYQYNAKRLDRELERLADLGCRHGTAFMWTYGDSSKGDYCVEARSAFDLRQEPGAVNDRQASWMAVREVVKKVEAIRMFEGSCPNIAEILQDLGQQNQMDRIRNMSSMVAVPKDSVELFYVYWKDGRQAVMSNEQYLWRAEATTPNAVFPIQVHRYQSNADRFWGSGLIYPLLDLQIALNRVYNRMLDCVDQMSNPVWLVPAMSNVNINTLTNVIGQRIPYNPTGGKPERVQGSMIGQDQFEIAKLIYSQMQDIAETHAQSMGKRAVGVNSGKAIDALANADAGQLELTKQDLMNVVRDLTIVVLAYMRDTWGDARYIRVFDQYGRVMHRELEQTDLLDNPTVHIESGSLFKSDVEAKQQQVLQWVQAGAIDPKEALKRTTLRNFNKDRMTQMLRSFRAQSVLDIAKHGEQHGIGIEIYPSDPVEEIKEAFEDFMWSPDFYQPWVSAMQAGDVAAMDVAKRQQDYIRTIYVSLLADPNAPAQQVDQVADKSLYPRAPAPPAVPGLPVNPGGNPNPQTGPMHPEQLAQRQEATEGLADRRPNFAGGSGAIA